MTVSVQVQDEDGVRSNVASIIVTVLPPPTPKFSMVPQFPSDCICTPLVMNTNARGNEYWFVKARGTSLDITLIAHSVNANDPETVEARVFDTVTGVQVGGVLSASYPAGTLAGTEVGNTQSYATEPDRTYRVQIKTPNTPGSQSHYRLKFEGVAEAAIKSPAFASLEAVTPVAWFFPIAANDNPQFEVFWDGVPLPPNNVAPWITVQWGDAGQPIGTPQTLTGPAPQTIAPPGLPKGRTWTLVVQSTNSHYRLRRTDAANDPDIYLTAVSYGQGNITGTVTTGGGSPFNPSVTVVLRRLTPSEVVKKSLAGFEACRFRRGAIHCAPASISAPRTIYRAQAIQRVPARPPGRDQSRPYDAGRETRATHFFTSSQAQGTSSGLLPPTMASSASPITGCAEYVWR